MSRACRYLGDRVLPRGRFPRGRFIGLGLGLGLGLGRVRVRVRVRVRFRFRVRVRVREAASWETATWETATWTGTLGDTMSTDVATPRSDSRLVFSSS